MKLIYLLSEIIWDLLESDIWELFGQLNTVSIFILFILIFLEICYLLAEYY